MSDEADDILASLSLTDEEIQAYATVKGKLHSYFIGSRNVIYERVKFNQRKQESGKTIKPFITSLYKLAENCGYGTLRDDLVRYRLVVGIRDKQLSVCKTTS